MGPTISPAAKEQPVRFDRIVGVFGMRFAVGAERAGDETPEFDDYDAIVRIMGENLQGHSTGKIKVISGGSRGVEKLVERWCRECEVPFERIKPDHGGAEGRGPYAFDKRNTLIISRSSEIFILWDGNERGFDALGQNALILGNKVTYFPLSHPRR